MDTLPRKILAKIFSFLSVQDLLKVRNVCTVWRQVIDQSSVWNDSRVVCDVNTTVRFRKVIDAPRHCHLLSSITIDCKRNAIEAIDAICISCKNIRSLVVKNMITIPCTLIRKVSMNCRKIEIFELPETIRLTMLEASFDRVLGINEYDVFQGFINLRKLNISHFQELVVGTTSLLLQGIIDQCEHLEQLLISMATFVLDEDVIYVAQHRNKNLLSLSLNGHSLTDISYSKLGALRKLKCLELICAYSLSDLSVKNISELHLTSLSITENKKLSSDTLAEMFAKRNMRRLKHLDLSFCSQVDDAVALSLSTHCQLLEHLNLRNTNITENGIKHIILECSRLEFLDIWGLDVSSGNSINLIPTHLKHLKVLVVQEGNRMDKILHKLETQLSHLKLET